MNENAQKLLKYVSNNDFESVKTLLATDANDVDVNNIYDENGVDLLAWAFTNHEKTLVEQILSISPSIDYCQRSADILEWACQNNYLNVINLMIEKHSNFSVIVNTKANNGNLALITALKFNHKEVVDILLKYNAQILRQDNNGDDALICACRNEDEELVERFLSLIPKKRGLNNQNYQDGNTALMEAVLKGNEKLVKLLAPKAILFYKNLHGFSPLMWSCQKGQIAIVRELLKYKAKVNEKNIDGNTLLMLAANAGHVEIVELLLKYKAKIDEKNNDGKTALMLAVKKGHLKIVKLLIKFNANLDIKDNDDNNALMLAINNDNSNVVEYLVNKFSELVNYSNNSGEIPLMWACAKGNHSIVLSLLIYGAAINARSNTGETALMWAAANGHTKIIELLLLFQARPDMKSNDGETALMWAAANGHIDIVEILFSNYKNNIDDKNSNGDTALMWAARNGHIDIVNFLLRKKANIAATNNYKYTALLHAAENNQIEIIKLLLDYNASVYDENVDGNTVLMLVIQNCEKKFLNSSLNHDIVENQEVNRTLQLIDLLLVRGADPTKHNQNNDTPLLFAIRNNALLIVEKLLKFGNVINVVNKNGDTPLIIAAENGNVAMVKLLLKYGADVHHKNSFNDTALLHAAAQNKLEIVKLLLEHGANPNVENKNGDTALMFACENKDFIMVKELLHYGARTDVANNNSDTPLLFAAKNDDLNIVTLLIIHTSEVNVQNNDGYSPLMFACENNNLKMVKALFTYGAAHTINTENKNGDTALMFACENNNLEMVKVLLGHGANNTINLQNSEGNTALMLVMKNDNKELVELLLEHGADANRGNYDMELPLAVAIENDDPETVKLLLDYGANCNYQTFDNETALMLAIKNNYDNVEEIVDILIKRGANINLSKKDGHNALTLVVKKYYQLSNIEKDDELRVLKQNCVLRIIKQILLKNEPVNYFPMSQTILFQAVKKPDFTLLSFLIRTYPNLPVVMNWRDNNGDNLLMVSIKNMQKSNHPDYFKVIELLAQNEFISLDTFNNDNNTALMEAIIYNQPLVVKKYLISNFTINHISWDNKTPLILAAERGDTKLVELLLEHGADVNMQKHYCDTPLMVAAAKGHFHMVKLLVSKVNINNANVDGDTALLRVIKNYRVNSYDSESKKNYLEIIKFLLDRGANFEHFNKNGENALVCAVKTDDINMINLLLSYDKTFANYKYKCADPLTVAYEKFNRNAVKNILLKSKNINYCKKGLNILIWAIKTKDVELVELLLKLKINFSNCYCDIEKNTALMLACEKGDEKIVKLLLEAGANVHNKNNSGDTALMLACEKGDEKIVKLLLEAGANADDKNKNLDTALIFACENGKHENIIAYLIKYGANVNACNNKGETALMLACKHGNKEMILMLLEHGADIDFINNKGENALSLAHKNNIDVVNLMEKCEETKKMITNIVTEINEQNIDVTKERNISEIVIKNLKKIKEKTKDFPFSKIMVRNFQFKFISQLKFGQNQISLLTMLEQNKVKKLNSYLCEKQISFSTTFKLETNSFPTERKTFFSSKEVISDEKKNMGKLKRLFPKHFFASTSNNVAITSIKLSQLRKLSPVIQTKQAPVSTDMSWELFDATHNIPQTLAVVAKSTFDEICLPSKKSLSPKDIRLINDDVDINSTTSSSSCTNNSFPFVTKL